MKVKIGKYIDWIGPYQIADKIFFWTQKYPDDDNLLTRWDYKLAERFGNWLAKTWVGDFCQWIYSKRKRTIVVKLDRWDTWSADHTLAIIIVPLLKQLKETKHGYGFVDDKDVPKELRSTNGEKDDYGSDSLAEKRYEYILDEMIWTFTQLASDKDAEEDKFYDHSKVDINADIDTQVKQLKVDHKGLKAYQDRIDNGTRLFGKYYRTLWD
jgi:hypothetical protein